MDVLVLSPCSKEKRHDPVIGCEAVDTHSREELVREYADRVAPAADMYTGGEHQLVQAAVSHLREVASADWYIVSAGFGLLRADTEIPSYDCGFSRENIASVRARAERAGYDVDGLTNDETIRAVGREKGIPREFGRVLNRGYDLLFVVLSEPYLLSVADVLDDIPNRTTAFAYASEGSKQLVGDCRWVPATESDREALGTTWITLRGEMFSRFASNVDEQRLRDVRSDSSLVQTLSS